MPPETGKNVRTFEKEPPEIKLETLQRISFELIGKSLELWRTYQDSKQVKGLKINQAVRIHQMVVEAMKLHPDIQELSKLRKLADVVEAELAIARKIHPIRARAERAK